MLTMAIGITLRNTIPEIQFQIVQANYYYLDHFLEFPVNCIFAWGTTIAVSMNMDEFS